MPARALSDAYIVSIDPQRATASDVLAQYGKVVEKLQAVKAKRIILANPPDIPMSEELPNWSVLLSSGVPVFVPSRHRFADISRHDGFVQIDADSDGVLRRSELWHLNGGVMSPSLPLAPNTLGNRSEEIRPSNRLASVKVSGPPRR